jgi:hypothetical protein
MRSVDTRRGTGDAVTSLSEDGTQVTVPAPPALRTR